MGFVTAPPTRLQPYAALVVGLLVVTPRPTLAQQTRVSAEDSAQIVADVQEAQRGFEAFRESRIPVQAEPDERRCDQQIGRICVWYGGEAEAIFPEERPEVQLARHKLLSMLSEAAREIHDPWITGELVRYLVENGSMPRAEQTARDCGLAPSEAWWCSALVGYVLHLQNRWIEADTEFEKALDGMPADERQQWQSFRYIVSGGAEKTLDGMAPEARAKERALFWELSDPLYLVDGNDRLTDHFARWVQAVNERDAANPQLWVWEADLDESLIRYGRIRGYSREYSPQSILQGVNPATQDTRRIVGHHHPQSRGYLFPEKFLQAPSRIPPESWITPPRIARTWYAPPYAPFFSGLETQVGRFRRGDDMLVVGAYKPAPPPAPNDSTFGETERDALAQPIETPVQAGLFLVSVDDGQIQEVRDTVPEGVFTLTTTPGDYVSSLEVLDAPEGRAWRARQGVRQTPLTPGLIAVSDLMILKPDAPLPETMDQAIPLIRPGVRIRQGEHFNVVWEVYGLQVREPVQVTLGFTRGHPDFLAPVGEFQGTLDLDRSVSVTFQDTGPDQIQSVFRSVGLELPALEPGLYTLHLKLELPGREPVFTSRPIVVE